MPLFGGSSTQSGTKCWTLNAISSCGKRASRQERGWGRRIYPGRAYLSVGRPRQVEKRRACSPSNRYRVCPRLTRPVHSADEGKLHCTQARQLVLLAFNTVPRRRRSSSLRTRLGVKSQSFVSIRARHAYRGSTPSPIPSAQMHVVARGHGEIR